MSPNLIKNIALFVHNLCYNNKKNNKWVGRNNFIPKFINIINDYMHKDAFDK